MWLQDFAKRCQICDCKGMILQKCADQEIRTGKFEKFEMAMLLISGWSLVTQYKADKIPIFYAICWQWCPSFLYILFTFWRSICFGTTIRIKCLHTFEMSHWPLQCIGRTFIICEWLDGVSLPATKCPLSQKKVAICTWVLLILGSNNHEMFICFGLEDN